MADYGWRNDQGWRGEERRRWDQNQNRMRGYNQGPTQDQDDWRDNDRYSQSRLGDDNRGNRDDWRGSERDYQEQDYGAGYATPVNNQGRFGSPGRLGRGDWRNQGQNSGMGFGGYPGGDYADYGDWRDRSYTGEARNRFASGSGYDHDRSRETNRNFWNKATDEVASWAGDDDASRRREMDHAGSHAGRGPKGYVRSDERIRDDVNDRLTDDWQLDATNIEVLVVSGEVTLTGTVDSRQDKRRAEDLADHISGVQNVQNNLRVQQQGWSSGATTESQSSSPGSQSRQGSYGSTSNTGTGTGSSTGTTPNNNTTSTH